ncbi:MAG: hypothetical protein ACPGIA_10240 [Luteolibacter sp.]
MSPRIVIKKQVAREIVVLSQKNRLRVIERIRNLADDLRSQDCRKPFKQETYQ